MAVEYLAWALNQEIEGAGRKFVLAVLGDASDGDGRSWRGQKTLAFMTGQSERSVRQHLDWLEAHGYIRRERRHREDGTRTSDYCYLPEKDATGNIRRWSTTGKNCRKAKETTGKSRQTYRQNLPNLPAESAAQEPSVEPSVEPSALQTSKTQNKPAAFELARSPKGDTRSTNDYREIWNENRGPLPAIRTLSEARRRKLRNLDKEFGPDQARKMFRAATQTVAQNDFWIRRGYGFDNLLRGKVEQYAEQTTPQNPVSTAAREATDFLNYRERTRP